MRAFNKVHVQRILADSHHGSKGDRLRCCCETKKARLPRHKRDPGLLEWVAVFLGIVLVLATCTLWSNLK